MTATTRHHLQQPMTIPGQFLVRGGGGRDTFHDNITPEQEHPSPSADRRPLVPILISDTSLSFWGGIDPITGMVMDQQHPLYDQCISDIMLCLPSGRGSCTASQVVLELILHRIAPRAIIVRDRDALLCIGAIIAQEFFASSVPAVCDILYIGPEGYTHLLNIAAVTCGVNNKIVASSSLSPPPPPQQLLQPYNQEQPLPLYGRILSNGQLQLQTTNTNIEPVENVIDANDDVVLTFEEQIYLNQCTTEAERMSLRVIFRYARLSWSVKDNVNIKNDAQRDTLTTMMTTTRNRYVPIQQAHIDGCTYIGPGGLEFVRRLKEAGGMVKIPTTLNAVSTDRRYWKKYHVPETYATNAIALGDAYLTLGCSPSYTCAPYLLSSSAPKMGQDIAWGESNAVVYANSVIGARTEKYADYLDICCAIAGIVPAIGVHIVEQRRPTMVLDGTSTFQEIKNLCDTVALDIDLLFPTLGHLCGSLSDGRVPILIGLENWNVSTDHLKAFCAAFGTTASSPLIHIAGITPEAKDATTIQNYISTCDDQIRTITLDDLYHTFQMLDSLTTLGNKDSLSNKDARIDESVDLVAIGNPHLSVSECQELAHLIQQTNPDDSTNVASATTRIIACLSRTIYAQTNPHHIDTMHQFGIEFIFDTCWCMLLNEPIIPTNPNAVILTNSGKYAHYGPGLTKRQFRYGSMLDCITAARTGFYPQRAPTNQVPLIPSTTSTNHSFASFLMRRQPQHRSYCTMTLRRPSNSTQAVGYTYSAKRLSILQYCRVFLRSVHR
jgi:cis-L-3-hydroxyproline dehydratase